MRAALLGWLFFFIALIGGYMIGRYRRFTGQAERRGRAVEAQRLPAKAAPLATPPATVASTAAPADLPSDYRRPESVPPSLK